jgi:hypothetical protein
MTEPPPEQPEAIVPPTAEPVAPPAGQPAPVSDRNALYILMLNLLYPAVLGTIFYTFLQIIFQGAWLTDWNEAKKMLYAFGVVCHYHIDFLYVYSFEVYKRFAFFVDLAVVALLYRAFAALTPNPPDMPNYRTFFISFLLIYLIFLPHELLILRRYIKEGSRELIRAHVQMLIHEVFGCTYFIICMRRPQIADSMIGAAILLILTFNYALILRARTKHKKII